MSKTIKADGKTYVVPDDATDEEINQIVGPASGELPTKSQPSTGRKLLNVAGDVGTGVVKGMGNTVSGVSSLLNKIPVLGETLAPSAGVGALKKSVVPSNAAQKAGYYGEQIGEFLLPGEAEESALAHLPQVFRAGKVATGLSRAALQTLSSGALNKIQGGSFKEGAEGGAIGAGLGAAGRAIAPTVAESALGITRRMRGYGKTPGEAVLNEVRGIRPGVILKNASDKTGQLTSEIEGMAASHPGTVSLRPARSRIADAVSKATRENNAGGVEQLGKVGDAINTNASTGLPLAADQTASGALNLKRGLRNQFVKNWNPELMHGTRAVAADASHAIDSELDHSLGPEFSSKNQRLSSLIPVAERAESLERAPEFGQRVLGRFGAHTGALTGAAIGGAEGYREGGLPRAIGMGVTGALLPEMIASPMTQMSAARIINNPNTFRGLSGSVLQLLRRRDSEDENGDSR
jgi:hypothetical protein